MQPLSAPCTPPPAAARSLRYEEEEQPPATPPRRRICCPRTPSAPKAQRLPCNVPGVASYAGRGWESTPLDSERRDLCVTGLSGNLCSISANLSWRILELKAAIEHCIGIPAIQQQLVVGSRELDDDDELLHRALPDAHSQITLVRRSQQQAEQLKLIAERSLFELLNECEAEIQQAGLDWYVAVAFMQRDARLLERLPAVLRADRRVVLAAVRRFPLMLDHASEQLKADWDVVLAAAWLDPHALEYADKALRADRDFVLAAMQGEDHVERLLSHPKEVLQRARLVLGFAAPELVRDPQLLRAAGLRSDWTELGSPAAGRSRSPQRVLRAPRFQ